MKIFLAFALILLPGCSTIVTNLPTVKYCSKVSYERLGLKAKLTMECDIPQEGESPIPQIL